MAIGSVLLAVCLLTTACTDNYDNVSQQPTADGKQPITFTVDDSQDWYETEGETLTRTTERFHPVPISMTGTTNAVTGMTMTATVVNGINSDGLKGKQKAPTRGTALTEMPASFGLYGYCFNNGTPWGTQTPTMSFNDQVTKDALTGLWKGGDNLYWPTQENAVRFFAYIPYVNTSPNGTVSNYGMTLSGATAEGSPTITYSVPTKTEDQQDLMTAATVTRTHDIDLGNKVKLSFKHNLTCVRFKLGDGFPVNSTIQRIVLHNIVGKAVYTIGEGWTLSGNAEDNKDFVIEDINMSGSAKNTMVTTTHDLGGSTAYSTLLMIPQAFTSDEQKVVVAYDPGTGAETALIEASLKGEVWLEGTSVTYTLSKAASDYTYQLEVNAAQAGYNGGQSYYGVTSYRISEGNTKTAVPWEIIGYSADGKTFTETKPTNCDWAGIVKTRGNGGVEMETGSVLFEPQTDGVSTTLTSSALDQASHTKQMQDRGRRARTEDTAFDLSTHNVAGDPTAMNTANCYVVNAPGYYKIPLVYGNAIKNGAPNRSAYENPANTSMPYLKDYLDRNIQDPYIYNNYTYGDESANGTTTFKINSASIVWQDEYELINTNSIKLSADRKYIIFEVDSTNIKQGNAVIAVKDNYSTGGRIMWSWHIWVTDVDIMATQRVYDWTKNAFELMPMNLGFCTMGGKQVKYEPRTMWIRVRQQGGVVADVPLTQMGGMYYSEFTNGNGPYYQWGRKDPLRPNNGVAGGNKDVYPTNACTTYSGRVTQGTAIQNPHTMFLVNDNVDWCSVSSPTYWCGNNTLSSEPSGNYKIIKTVYDPCPVGFHIPEYYVFTFMTLQGGWSTTSDWIVSSVATGGYHIKVHSLSNETVFLPNTIGYRECHTSNVNISGGFHAWTGCKDEASTGNYVCIRRSNGRIETYHTRNVIDKTISYQGASTGYGIGVRPVADY